MLPVWPLPKRVEAWIINAVSQGWQSEKGIFLRGDLRERVCGRRMMKGRSVVRGIPVIKGEKLQRRHVVDTMKVVSKEAGEMACHVSVKT